MNLRKTNISLILILLLSPYIHFYGQVQYEYSPLKSSGAIPNDFIFSFSEKYNKKIRAISPNASEKGELEKSFYIESFYHLDQLLNSGKVVFNDPASKYVAKVADIILKDQPEIREKLRFYIVRSSSVNAFTSSEGIILINLGLLCQVKNEAELAYILCHEISHYIEKHPLDIYLNNNELFSQSQSSSFQKYAFQKALLETNKYSREKEEQADQLGLDLFLKSNYSIQAAVDVFEMLRNDNELFDNSIVSANTFNSKYLNFSDTSFFGSFPQTVPTEIEKYSTSNTHPNPKRRQTLIRRKVRKMDNSKKKEYLFSAEEFKNVQTQCRFDLVSTYLLEKKYERAIYTAKVLLQKHPNHPFLEKEIGYALFALANYANSGRFWDVHIDFLEKNAPENRLNYLFDVLEDEQLNLMSILYNWNLLKENPSQRNMRCLEMIIFQFGTAFYNDEYFNNSSKDPFKKGLKLALEEPEFKKIFEDAIKNNPQEYVTPLDNSLDLTKPEIRKLKGYHYGIDKVVFVDPFFQHYDNRKEFVNQYFKSEKAKKHFLSLINQYSDQFHIQSKILSPDLLGTNDTELHNQMSLVKLWLLEKNSHENMPWVSLYYDDVQKLIPIFQSPYIVSLGGIGIKQNRKSKNLTLVAGFLFPPILPYSLFYNFTPQQDFFLYSIVYDLQKDASNSFLSKRIRMKADESVMHSQLYDFFLQLHQKPKE